MENLLDGWGITLATFSPLVGAAVMMLIPREREDRHKMVALVTSLWVAFVGVLLLLWFDLDHTDRLQFAVDRVWIDVISSHYSVGIDGMSLPLILMTMLVVPACIVYSWNHFPEPTNPKAFLILILILETGMIGTFVAQDLVLFFVFFEVVLLPMFFMIAVWGGEDRRYASLKFFLFTLFGSALMLVSFLALFFLTGADTFTFTGLADAVAHGGVSRTAQLWIFGGMFLGFGIKVPMFPFHTWLPDAHTQAPTVGSVILAAVLLKLGTYGFLRFGLYLFPEAAHFSAPLFMTLGVVGILYGGVVATMQRDLKRLVAYSSVAHLGFIILGTFALNTEGIEGGLLMMVNHGISTGALFLLVGMIYERRHTRLIDELGGLQRAAPVMAGVFMVVMLSSIGLPGLNGFVGEFLVLVGAFMAHRWWAVVAAAGVVLAALYMLWAYQRVFHGPAEGDNTDMADLNIREGLVLAPLLALIVFLGVYPKPVIERMQPAVDALVAHVERHVPAFDEPVNLRVAQDLPKADDMGDGS